MQPIYLAILSAVITSVATAVAALSPQRAKVAHVAIFIGAVVAMAASLWSDSQQRAKEKEVSSLQSKLMAAQDKILAANQELKLFTAGADSYSYFEPTVSSAKHGAIGALVNAGKYPMYDVSVRIMADPELRLPIQAGGAATYEIMKEKLEKDLILQVGTLGPSDSPTVGYPSLLHSFDFGDHVQRRAFNVFISARNVRLTQLLRFRRVGARWFVAYKVARQVDGGGLSTPLKEVIQPGYPVEPDGSVNWLWQSVPGELK